VILRQYHGRLPLYHIDFYRLDSIEAIATLGLEEYFYGDGVCVVEWAEKGLEIARRDNLLVTIHYIPACQTGRSICLKPQGERYCQLVEEIRKKTELWR
jgi:tRNA threonylcarbamoyladenosine biosynthesis protein TsaE